MNPQLPRASSSEPISLNWIGIAALAAFVIVWLATLATRSLVSADEGRYATLSLAILQSGDWITPRLNGLLYLEKPPLQYWAGAVAMALFGINEFAARLWPGLSGLAAVFLVGFTARRLWGPAAGMHALIIAGATTWIVLNSHFLSLDSGLCAALTLVLCSVLLAQCAPQADDASRRRWMLAAWAGMALAVLSKGPIGLVIPGATLVVHSIWRRDLTLLRQLQWLRGALIFALIAAPWFVLVSVRNPDFVSFFFVHEHLQRYLTPVHQREGAWWYFIPYLLLGFMPWTSTLPWLLLRARRADLSSSLLVVWALFVFAFFSASSSKLPSYILPLFPALALLLARLSAQANAAVMQRHLVLPALGWIGVLVASAFAARWASVTTPIEAVTALARGAAVGSAVFLVGAVAATILLRKRQLTAALAVVAASHLVAVLVALGAHDTFGQLKSSARIAPALVPAIDDSTPVFAVRAYDQTLPFYLRRPVVLVDYRDEFAFGQDHEPGRWIPTLDAFAARWRSEPRAAAYTNQATLRELRGRGLDMRVVFEDPRRVVVTKP